MMKRLVLSTLALAICTPLSARAQTVTESLDGLYGITKTNIMETAELMSGELLAYRPTDEVRSMGEILGHVADAQFTFCSAAAGEDNPRAGESFEQTRSTKAGLVEALEMGFTYCDGVYDGMTDEAGARPVQFFGANTALGVLAFNSAHNYEHYGNLVTYMRMNGIVPPSSR